MLTITKGSSATNKLLVKTRRGISQKIDNIDCQKEHIQKNKDATHLPEMSSPKPVFHQNGRRSHQQKSPQEAITPQHEEMIRYIHETWKCVKREYELTSSRGPVDPNTVPCATATTVAATKVPKICYYNNKAGSATLPSFEPFDLETFWGQRLFQNITQSAS